MMRHSVHAGLVVVRLVRGRPLLHTARSLLHDGPDRTIKGRKHGVNHGIVVVVVVGKGKKGG